MSIYEISFIFHPSSSNRNSTLLLDYPLVALQPFTPITYKILTHHERADFIEYSVCNTSIKGIIENKAYQHKAILPIYNLLAGIQVGQKQNKVPKYTWAPYTDPI